MAVITSVSYAYLMWPFFSKSWLGRLGRAGPAVARDARELESRWRVWLADGIMNVNQGVPCAPENAVRELRVLPVQKLLALDEELRRSAYYLNEASVGRTFVLSPAAAPVEETTAYLFSACCHGNGHIREASLKALGNQSDRLAFAAALIRCDDWVPQVQRAAVGLLNRLLGSDSASAIFELLPLFVRLGGRKRISEEIWPQRVAPSLRLPSFKDARWNGTRSPDVEALAYAYRLVFEADPERRREAIVQASADRHPKISIWALNFASRLPPGEAESLERDALRHSHSGVRAQALRLYAELGPAELREVLEAFLFDAARGPRDAAVFLLDQRFKEAALRHWREALDSQTAVRRHIALVALSYAAEPEDVGRLKPFLKDSSARIRAFALRGLVRADAARAEEYLVAALKDASAFVIRYSLYLASKQKQLFALKDLQEAFESSPSEATRRQLSFASRLLGKWDSLEFLFWLTTVEWWGIASVGIDRWLAAANRRFTSLDEHTRVRLLDQLQEVAARVPDDRWSRVEVILRRS
jgi:HEAT repeat protein